MGHRPRPKPKYLAAKLFAIRERLGLSQAEMARLLDFQLTPARISEYESSTREPNLIVLLRYSEVAGLHMETIVNDKADLPEN
jgi:transcriptional regulator with XRE-family HTH domain